jgi:hypothetical protein
LIEAAKELRKGLYIIHRKSRGSYIGGNAE